jgi:hypothetical protein
MKDPNSCHAEHMALRKDAMVLIEIRYKLTITFILEAVAHFYIRENEGVPD